MENLKINQTGITEILLEDENGLKQGKYFKYENGRIKEEGQYKDGKKDGKWNEYPIDEKKIREKTYIDGEIISERVIKKNFLDSIKNMITKSISNENSEMKIKRKIIKKSKEEELEL
jgi:hypothetical protein